MSRNIREVLADLARLYDELQTRDGASVIDLAGRLGVPRQRVYDYFGYLQAFFGEDCLEVDDGRYSWGLEAPRPVRMGLHEQRVLAIAHALLAQIGMPFGEAFERLFVELSGGDRGRAAGRRREQDREAGRERPPRSAMQGGPRSVHFASPFSQRFGCPHETCNIGRSDGLLVPRMPSAALPIRQR